MRDESSKISNHWGKHEPILDDPGFYTSPVLRPYFIESAYGKDLIPEYQNNSYFAEDIFMAKYLKNRRCSSILSLCCGFGNVERRFVSKLNSVEQCTGVDLSEGALKVARTRAREENLQNMFYECADLNDYTWQESKYDLVIVNGGLHHLNSLEKVFEGIKYTLRPGGMLYACEYVGPSYQDHDIRQLELINACSFLIPPELRARIALPININNELLFKIVSKCYSVANKVDIPTEWPQWKKMVAKLLKLFLVEKKKKLKFGVVHRSPKKYLLKVDPSECVRSSEIIPLSKKYFPNIEIFQFGGGILQHALNVNFYSNFNKNNPNHIKCLELLCSIERHFMATNEIGVENAFLIVSK